MPSSSDYIAGVEIGGTKIQIALGTSKGEILKNIRYPVLREHAAAGIQKQVLDGLKALWNEQAFHAIGVGFGGPIDWKTGRVFKSHHIQDWENFPLTDWLHSELNAEVFADNDANVAALAEAKLGAGQNKDPVFYMTIGSGIGGGIIHRGRIYHGKCPGEVEIGHTRIPAMDLPFQQWPTLEELCSGWTLDSLIRDIVKSNPGSIIAKLIGPQRDKEAHFLLEAKLQGDPHAIHLWEKLIRCLTLVLSHVVHLFHPEVLVIGGGVSKYGQQFLDEIRLGLHQIVMKAYQGTYEVFLSQLDDLAVPIGALLLTHHGNYLPAKMELNF